jgi:hypothetical protein
MKMEIVMKNMIIVQRHLLYVSIMAIFLALIGFEAFASDPLPSWREGPNKQLIIAFVEKVITPGGSSFVAPQDRVATFDMDGTVLLEKPAYALFSFAIPLIKAAATAKPALLERPHVKAIVEGDMKYFATAGKFGPQGLYATLLETHSGKTEAHAGNDPLSKGQRLSGLYLFGV